ncbi:MAG: outer membrane beta-barrel protein [Polyangiaceae bacterium]|nr:outer membrane beta-barrel protein [Polyangiaceae bacterium]
MRTFSFACFAALAATPLFSTVALAQPATPPPAASAAPPEAAPAEKPPEAAPTESTAPAVPPAEGAAPVEAAPAPAPAAAPEVGASATATLSLPAAPAPEAAPVAPAPTPVPEVAPAAEAPAAKWYEAAEYRVFVDSFYGMNWNLPKPQLTGNGQSEVRAYDVHNGFGLSWAGADLSLPAAPVGGTLSLRFGPSAVRYSGCVSTQVPCDKDIGLTNVKQAFASYSPVEGLTLDLGKFDTIYGAEVADSQDNMNYTRGVLYWLGQPLFHTGLRAEYQATKELAATLLLVNGWNNSVDNNVGKSIGLQGKFATEDGMFSVALGYLGGPEQDDTDTLTCEPGFALDPNVGCVARAGAPGGDFPVDRADSNTKGWRHFLDLVVGANPTKDLAILANASLGIDNARDPDRTSTFTSSTWWGAMLGARYDLGNFGVGGRGEYFDDKDAFAVARAKGTALMTGTLTLDADLGPNVLLKLDNRFDWADKKMFQSGIRKAEGSEVTSTLGVVATVP